MILSPGARLGPYEVVAPLGSGGMGEVYRAHDTTLGRDVALKVLSAARGPDPANHARFEREARALAALNHANVATVHGVERLGDSRVIVMELVEGETLAERLTRGPLPVCDALTIARQIAEAIEAAHVKGIVHRDLKPANIKITPAGVVKVLDFGLAKSAGGSTFDATLPTIDATHVGVIVGTPAYMSPQQARGQAVERDADIWAFGCVLYEMLAGRRAFSGATIPDIVANVLQRDPDWPLLPATTPPQAVRLVRRCLAKEPARRVRDIADARLEIEDILSGAASEPERTAAPATSRWPLVAMTGLVLTVGVAAGIIGQPYLDSGNPGVPAATASVFGMSEPPGESLYVFVQPISLSPDGRRIALITHGQQGQPRLWLRSLDELEPKRVDVADGAMFPFWSPNGRSLAFIAEGQLRVVDLASMTARALTSVSARLAGGTWHPDGTILFVDGMTGLKRIPASGGTATPVPAPGPSNEPALVVAPQFLPGGHAFLYFAASRSGRNTLMLGDLDSDKRTPILTVETIPRYADPGFLVYVRNGELVAQRFDVPARTIRGDPIVISRSAWVSSFLTTLSVSQTGMLAFGTQRTPISQLSWFDRSGKPLGAVGDPALWIHTAISPDVKVIAAERLDMRTGSGVTWLIDAVNATASRLSLRPGWTMAPVWSSRGDRIAFASSSASTGEGMEMVTMPVDGSGREESVWPLSGVASPTDWLLGGRGLVISIASPATGNDVATLAAEGKRALSPLVQTAFNESSGKVSPDGRWLAYVSNESGRPEIYVRPLDGGTGRWPVSQHGGSQPRWRRDGRELFFVSETNRIMAVPITPGALFAAGRPVELPIETERDLTGGRFMYDVADLGQRFLVIRRTSQELAPPITIMMNWPLLLSAESR